VIHWQSPYMVVYLVTDSERYFTLDGCHRISHYSVGYSDFRRAITFGDAVLVLADARVQSAETLMN
jgi:hypothetical protein